MEFGEEVINLPEIKVPELDDTHTVGKRSTVSRKEVYNELKKFDLIDIGRPVTRFEFLVWYWALYCKWKYHGTFSRCWEAQINHDHFFYSLCKEEVDELMNVRHEWWEHAFKSRVHTPQSLAHQFRRAVRRLEKSRARRVVAAYMKVCNAVQDSKPEESINNLQEEAKKELLTCIREDRKDTIHEQTRPVIKLFDYILDKEKILEGLHQSMLSLGTDIYTLEWCTNWMNFQMWFEDKGPGALLLPLRHGYSCMYTTLQPPLFEPKAKSNWRGVVKLQSIFDEADLGLIDKYLTFEDWTYLIKMQWRYGSVDVIKTLDFNITKLCFMKLGDSEKEWKTNYEADLQIIQDLAAHDEKKYQASVVRAHDKAEASPPPPLATSSLQERLKLNFGPKYDRSNKSGKSDLKEEAEDYYPNGTDNENIPTGGREAMRRIGIQARSKAKKNKKTGQITYYTEIWCPVCGSYHGLAAGSCKKRPDLSRMQFIEERVNMSDLTEDQKKAAIKIAKQGKKFKQMLDGGGFFSMNALTKQVEQDKQAEREAIKNGFIPCKPTSGSLWKITSKEELNKHLEHNTIFGWQSLQIVDPESGKIQNPTTGHDGQNLSNGEGEKLIDMHHIKKQFLEFLYQRAMVSKGETMKLDGNAKVKRSLVISTLYEQVRDNSLTVGKVIDLKDAAKFVLGSNSKINTVTVVPVDLPKLNDKIEAANAREADPDETVSEAVEHILSDPSFKSSRRFFLIALADHLPDFLLQQWRNNFVRNLFEARMISLKAIKGSDDNNSRYMEILYTRLKKMNYEGEGKNADQLQHKMKEIKNGILYPTEKADISDNLKKHLEFSIDRFFGLFEDQVQSQVVNPISNREQLLDFVRAYALACICEKYQSAHRMVKGQRLYTQATQNAQRQVVGYDEFQASETLDDIMMQREFESYQFTNIVSEVMKWEQDMVDFLNRFKWMQLNRQVQSTLDYYNDRVTSSIQKGQSYKKNLKEIFGSESLSGCLQCSVGVVVADLEKKLLEIQHAHEVDDWHLPHCPVIIRKWFDMNSKTERPIVLQKIIQFVNSNFEILAGDNDSVRNLCALEFVNIVYSELGSNFSTAHMTSRDSSTYSFWQLAKGCKNVFVEANLSMQFQDDENAKSAINSLGFNDWVQEMRELLQNTKEFYELCNSVHESTNKPNKDRSAIANMKKKQARLTELGTKLSINTKLVILVNEKKTTDRVFNLENFQFEPPESSLRTDKSTKNAEKRSIPDKLWNQNRLWEHVQKIFEIAVNGEDEKRAQNIEEFLSGTEYERYRLKRKSFIDTKKFVELKEKGNQILSEQEKKIKEAVTGQVRYLGVRGSRELHTVLHATLKQCLLDLSTYKWESKDIEEKNRNYIEHVSKVVGGSLKSMEGSSNAGALQQTLIKMGIFTTRKDLIRVHTALVEWINKLDEMGDVVETSRPENYPNLFFNSISKEQNVKEMLETGMGLCYLIWAKISKVSDLRTLRRDHKKKLNKFISGKIKQVADIQESFSDEEVMVIKVWSDLLRAHCGFVMDFSNWGAVRKWMDTQQKRVNEPTQIEAAEVSREECETGACFRDNIVSLLTNEVPASLTEEPNDLIAREFRLKFGIANGHCRILS